MEITEQNSIVTYNIALSLIKFVNNRYILLLVFTHTDMYTKKCGAKCTDGLIKVRNRRQ